MERREAVAAWAPLLAYPRKSEQGVLISANARLNTFADIGPAWPDVQGYGNSELHIRSRPYHLYRHPGLQGGGRGNAAGCFDKIDVFGHRAGIVKPIAESLPNICIKTVTGV